MTLSLPQWVNDPESRIAGKNPLRLINHLINQPVNIKFMMFISTSKKILSGLLLISGMALGQQNAKPKPPVKPDWESRIEKAREMYGEENYDGITETLLDVPMDDTSFSTANFIVTSAFLANEKYAEGVEQGWRGLQVSQSQYRRSLYDLIGAAYTELEKFDSALYTYQIGLKEFPNHQRFYFGSGTAYMGKKEYQKAVESFQYSVKLNPYHGLSHYYLGKICMENNYIIPAMLSYQMQLLVDDPGARCITALANYEKMAQGGWTVLPDSMYWKMPAGSNNFTDLEKIIRSKIALSDKYKSKVNLSYNTILKQMQVLHEQLAFNAADTGFWMQYYVPFFLDLWKKNHYVGYAYNAFAAVNESDVQKVVKKNAAVSEKMAVFAREYWNKYREDFWMNNKLTPKTPFFYGTGALQSVGEFDEKLQRPLGYWKYYFANGNINNEGNYDSNGKEQGVWKYHRLSGGRLSFKKAKDGELADSTWSFYWNGSVDEINLYMNGKLNGKSIGYYSTGSISGVVEFKEDMKHGKAKFYHENGLLKSEATYKDDKLDGRYVEYYYNGTKKEEYSYVNGLIAGSVKTWFDNGVLKSEGAYANGLIAGEWKYYSNEGKLNKKGLHTNGKETGKWVEYYSDGTMSEEYTFNAGKLDGDNLFYDTDGKLYCKLVFVNDKLMSYEYKDKSGKILSSNSRKSKQIDYQSYYPNGERSRKGLYSDIGKDGLWTQWYDYGVIKEEENFEKGVQQGLQKYYSDEGLLHSEFTYVDGSRNGLGIQYYDNGNVEVQGWYLDDNKEGEFIEYTSDGLLSERMFYINGNLNGDNTYYDAEGRPFISYQYYMGDVVGFKGYDTLGTVVYVDTFPSGNITTKTYHCYNGKKVDAEFSYKYGSLDGELKQYYTNGKLSRVVNYSNGSKNGSSVNYYFDGSLENQSFYKDGAQDSLEVEYFWGKKEKEFMYKDGDLNGAGKWYYPNNKVEISGDYKSDKRDGYFYYYSYNGELRFRLNYKEGNALSYSYLNADSTFVPEIPLPKGAGNIKAFFRNGKPSAEVSMKSNAFDGNYTLFFPDGKTALTTFFKEWGKEGVRKEYYPDGKLYKEESFVYNRLHGRVKYYNEKGVLVKDLNYKYGLLHGPAVIYDNTGKQISKIRFYNDQPLN